MKRRVFTEFYNLIIIITPYFIAGACLLLIGTAVKSTGYLLFYNIDALKKEWKEFYNQIKISVCHG